MFLDPSAKYTNFPFCVVGFFFFPQKTSYMKEHLWKGNWTFYLFGVSLPLKYDDKAENDFTNEKWTLNYPH